MSKIDTKHFFLLGIILAISLTLSIFTLYNGHVWGDDFSLYIKQAKSIVEGNTQECVSTTAFTVNYSSTLYSTVSYGIDAVPWGYPLLLSPIYYFFGINLLAMKYLNIVIFILLIIMVYFLFKNKFDSISILFITAIFGLNPYLLEFNNGILNDFPYLLLSLLSIFYIEKIILEERIFINKNFSFYILGFSISLAYFFRGMAITLIFTLIFCQLIKNKKSISCNFINFISKNKIYFIPYFVFLFFILLSWFIFPKVNTSHFTLLASIFDLNIIERIKHFIYYIELPSDFFGVQLSKVIYGITIPFFVYGVVKKIRKDYLYIFYSIATCAILLVWPGSNGLRYIFPILPFYFYFLIVGLMNLNRKFANAFLGLLILLIFAQSLFGAYTRTIERKIGKVMDGPFTEESTNMFNFISENTHNSDVIIFRKPRVLNLLTDRKSIFINKIEQLNRGNYIVIDKKLSPQETDNYLKNSFELFNLVYENARFKIYYNENIDKI